MIRLDIVVENKKPIVGLNETNFHESYVGPAPRSSQILSSSRNRPCDSLSEPVSTQDFVIVIARHVCTGCALRLLRRSPGTGKSKINDRSYPTLRMTFEVPGSFSGVVPQLLASLCDKGSDGAYGYFTRVPQFSKIPLSLVVLDGHAAAKRDPQYPISRGRVL